MWTSPTNEEPTEASHWRFEVRPLEILVEVLRVCRGVPASARRKQDVRNVRRGTAHIQVQTRGSALRGMPPPSSEILMVISCVDADGSVRCA